MHRKLLTNCRLFDGDSVHEGRAVVIEAGRIAGIVAADDVRDEIDTLDLDGHMLAPGLIDLQVNGGGGVLFNDAPTLDTLRTIVTAHRRFGTTACLPTLITDNAATMKAGIEAVADALDGQLPAVVGIHLEGPHLNPLYRGVHDATRMRALDEAGLKLLCSLRSPHFGRTLVTLAPELVPAETIRCLADAGVIVFGGHSAASYEETCTALAAGLSGFTHLFNAMTPLTSRAPGMVGAALDDASSYFSIIADGHHVHPASLRIAVRSKAAGKACLVTDAMPTVGSSDKQFTLNGVAVSAIDGRCVTADGVLAGSDIGMIDAVRNMTRFGGVDRYEALRMASAYPATALGIDDVVGYLRQGYRADLIQLDEDLNVMRSWIAGDMQAY